MFQEVIIDRFWAAPKSYTTPSFPSPSDHMERGDKTVPGHFHSHFCHRIKIITNGPGTEAVSFLAFISCVLFKAFKILQDFINFQHMKYQTGFLISWGK